MSSSRNSGFTLLEMLVAIAIFALLGLATNAVLQTVLKNDEVTRDFSAQLRYLQQGFGTIERDMGQIVARGFRSAAGGRGTTVVQIGNNMLQSESQAIVFYRIGWLNPGGLLPRGNIQSLAYVVKEGKLERLYYPYPDPILGKEPLKTVLMDKVVSVKYAVFTDGKWQQAEQLQLNTLPTAIAIEVELEDRGIIMRKFLLPVGAPSSESDSNKQNSDNKQDSNSDNNDTGNGSNSGDNNGEQQSGNEDE